MTSQRYHYIDRSRALLMLCGIPYHAAMMYAYDWGPAQGSVSLFCTVVAQTLTEFRMPAFFLIAGFFAAMGLTRTRRTSWLAARLQRLVIPLVTASILILPLQALLLSMNAGTISEVLNAWHLGLRSPGNWISHLWFLYDLIIYSTATIAAWPAISRIATIELPRPLKTAPFVSLVVATVIIALPLVLAAPALGHSAVGVAINRLLDNGVFYLLGIGLFLRRDVLERWLVWRWWQAAAAIVIIALAVPLVLSRSHERPAMLVEWAAAIAGTWLVLAAMKTWGDAPCPRTALLVDASLTIYLVHHPIIFGLGLLTALSSFPIEAEWSAVVAVTFVLSTGFYLLTRRVPILYYAFNGKRFVAIRPVVSNKNVLLIPAADQGTNAVASTRKIVPA